jgi:hypothetical protein
MRVIGISLSSEWSPVLVFASACMGSKGTVCEYFETVLVAASRRGGLPSTEGIIDGVALCLIEESTACF